jgi:hypothetical protein
MLKQYQIQRVLKALDQFLKLNKFNKKHTPSEFILKHIDIFLCRLLSYFLDTL